MKGPAKNTRYTSKLTLWHPPSNSYSNLLIQNQCFVEVFSERPSQEKPVASVDAHTAMVNALLMVLHAVSVAI